MGISCRMFLLDKDDSLYRLPNAKFDQILRDPTSCRLTRFAGSRVRMTVVAVELIDRQPICVVWITFGFLAFDEDGYFDLAAYDRHQRARAELALALPTTEPKSERMVVDATNRFVAQGSRWTPSRALQRRIDAAVLDQVKCTRLKFGPNLSRL